jgi:hypothetical protein
MAVSPAGLLYLREGNSYSGSITRYTMDPRHVPATYTNSGNNILTPYIYSRMGQGFAERGFDINIDNELAVMYMKGWNEYCVKVLQDAATVDTMPNTGLLLDPITGQCGGVQYDLQGNVYVGVNVRGSDHVTPSGFESDWGYTWAVGAIAKFDPSTGGATSVGGAVADRTVTGALKVYKTGLAPFSGNYECACRSPRFEVDPYGRIFIPNAITSKITVVDNNENLILQFGEYANVDSDGPGSAVVTNDVPLAWPVGVATSEDFIYITDMINDRLVQMRMNYILDNMPGLTGSNVAAEVNTKSIGRLSLKALPNPFRPISHISVNLPGNADINLDIYDVNGKFLKTITSGKRKAGLHRFQWDATDKAGRKVAAGIYVYRLTAGNRILFAKTILVK